MTAKGVIQEIVDNVMSEIQNAQENNGDSLFSLLIKEIQEAVVRQLEENGELSAEKKEKIEKKLKKAADRLGKVGTAYPNLKYRKPKYNGMDSVLKYIESEDEKGGLKLIIMNFND